MDDVNDDEAAMMAAMGLSGFGSTKVCYLWRPTLSWTLVDCIYQGKPVAGNQEGATNIKKTRTWRQYMNRRGGFNRHVFIFRFMISSDYYQFRPLDKIK